MGVAIIQAPSALLPSGNQIYFKVNAGNSSAADHRLIAVIHLETTPHSGSFTALPEMNLDADKDGYADVDLSRIIHSRMTVETPLISITEATATPLLTLRYKVIFTEYWNGQSSSKISGTYTAIRARINNYSSTQAISCRYLSDFPNKIDTYIASVHYLTCLFNTPGTYTAILQAYYSDGTSVDRTIANLTIEFPYKVHRIPTGLRHRNLAVVGKTLTQYTVTITNASGNITFPPTTYIVHLQEKKCIIYANRLGGIDTFFIEREKNTLKVDRENYLKPLHTGFSVTDCDTLTQTTSHTDTYEIGSGYITRQLQELYKELLISDKVFLVHNNNFLAINIEKGSFNLYSDEDDIYFIDFKITLGFSADFISSQNSLKSYSSDYDSNYE